MARIPYPDLDALDPEVGAFMKRIDPMVNVFHMMAHAQQSVRPFMRFGNALLFKTELDPILRELVILRVGHVTGAHYEVHQHRIIARKVGTPQDKIDAVPDGPDAPVFSEAERAALKLTDEVLANVRASDETFEACRKHFDARQLSELLLLIGFYQMLAGFLVNLEVELEPEGVIEDPLKPAAKPSSS